MIVMRKRIETCDINAMILTKIFKESNIYLSIFLTTPYNISFVLGVSYYIDRNEDYRGISWLFRKITFKPSEQSESKEKRVAAAFFHTDFC